MSNFRVFIMSIAFLLTLNLCSAQSLNVVKLKSFEDKKEVERIIVSSSHLPVKRRIEFISKYLIGRKYRPETKSRIKKQRGSLTVS